MKNHRGVKDCSCRNGKFSCCGRGVDVTWAVSDLILLLFSTESTEIVHYQTAIPSFISVCLEKISKN